MARLLYYCPGSLGGIIDYALVQAEALAAAGADVTFLTNPVTAARCKIAVQAVLEDESAPLSGTWIWRAAQRGRQLWSNIQKLKQVIAHDGYRHVLFASYTEYGAPFWAPVIAPLAQQGVHFGAMLHDPVRDYVVGPQWFHQRSIQAGYSFLRDVFVHEPVSYTEAAIPSSVQVTVVPHGPMNFPEVEPAAGQQLRHRLDIPASAKVLVSFGQIRDGKNLHLILEALKQFPDLWLLVAGKDVEGSQRRIQDYQEMARDFGVASRCRWVSGYIPAEEVGSYFQAADLVLMTYSRKFRSASGVLNTAVQFRRPCLCSSGPSALKSQVERYSLGLWVEPDQEPSIRRGLTQWLQGLPAPDWDGYRRENSWARNAELVMAQLLQ
jgi:glycosyltransferase involved in cell wall biosynthesis